MLVLGSVNSLTNLDKIGHLFLGGKHWAALKIKQHDFEKYGISSNESFW